MPLISQAFRIIIFAGPGLLNISEGHRSIFGEEIISIS